MYHFNVIRYWFILMFVMVGLSPTAFAQEIDLTPPELGTFDPASVSDINLDDYPILPEITDHAREIYARGVANGGNPQVFSKVGDCMTWSAYFMAPFGQDSYDLGEHEDLQLTIEYFGGVPIREREDWTYDSFANPSIAAASGFNTASVLDSIWSNPEWCNADESPLVCEYRLSNPVFSIIMFGTNDVFFIDAISFDYYVRTIVLETINADIVPILNTFPTRPEFPEQSILYNQIIINIAADYDLPLVNLWLAIEDLPNMGVDEVEPIHLSIPEDERTADFNDEQLEYGYTVRNLLTLQTLDILRQGFAD
jgi:hypothetical protein